MQTVASTWDIRVVSAMNAASVIAYVPRWTSIEFSDQLNDYGTGKLVHDFKDVFFANFESENGMSLLTGPYALQIVRNGAAVFTFFIEDVQVERLPDGETVTIAGKGIGSALDWAVVLPAGFSNQGRVGTINGSFPKLWDRDFVGYEWICRVATTSGLTANYVAGVVTNGFPGDGAELQGTTNGSINTAGIDGITDLTVGDYVLVKNQTNQAYNGIYWIKDVGSISTVWRLNRASTANGLVLDHLNVGKQAFISEGSTNGYSIFKLTSNGGLTSPSQIGSVNLVFGADTAGGINGLSAFWVLFKEAQTGYEYSASPEYFGYPITTNGRGGASNAVSWPIYLDSTIDANKGYLDSKGSVIQDAGRFTVPQGKTMGEVIKQVAEQCGLSWHFNASGSVSFAVSPFSRNGVVRSAPFGTDRTSGSSALLFTLPSLTNSETKSSVTDRRTVTYGSDQRGIEKIVSTNKSTYGIRESWFENSAVSSPAIINFTSAAMRKIDGAKLSQTATFPERTGQVAWVDFSVGDKVLVETAIGLYSNQIVSAISAQISNSNEQTIELTLGEVFPDLASDLETQGGYGSLNSSIIAGFTGHTPNVNLPAPMSASVVTTTYGMSNRVTVTWDNTDSRASQYEVSVFREGTMKTGFSLTRSGNVASGSKNTHGLTNGMLVNIYPTKSLPTDDGFAGFNVPLLNTTSGVIYWANQGPDISTPVTASVAQVLEFASVTVDGSKNSATIENLSSPGSTYSYVVTPINELGLKGTTSTTRSFTSSNEPFQLVGSAVQSSGFSSGVTGWRISASGAAEFNSITLPSSSAALDIGGDDATSFHVDSTGNMWLGASIANKATAPFRVSNAGYLTATTGAFSGQLDVGSGATSFHVDTSGNMWLGATTYAAAPFKVSNAGSITATTGTFSGTISSGTITGGTIDIGSGANSWHVDSAGNMWIGGATYAAAPFKISADGSVTSGKGATFSGSIVSSSDARFDGGAGGFSYIQNDGRFQSVTGVTVISQMGQTGIFVQDGTPFGSFNTTGSTTLRGIGIRYPDASFGPGFNNAMALQWNGSTPFVIVDNVYGLYLSGTAVSDRRVKVNIAEPSDEWIDKLLNQVKIYQFDKINPLNDEDLHVYKGHIGVMADEFKEIFPQFESSSLLLDPDGADAEKIRAVDYTFMIPGLLLIAQKFNARIKELEARIGA